MDNLLTQAEELDALEKPTPAADRLLRQAWAWLDTVADYGSDAKLPDGTSTPNSVYMRRLADEINAFLAQAQSARVQERPADGWLIVRSDGSREAIAGFLTDDVYLPEGDEAWPFWTAAPAHGEKDK